MITIIFVSWRFMSNLENVTYTYKSHNEYENAALKLTH